MWIVIHSIDRESLYLILYLQTRTKACEQVYRPAMDIVEEILLDNNRPFNTAGLKKSLLKRIANRARAALRPEEPKSLDFEVIVMDVCMDQTVCLCSNRQSLTNNHINAV